MRKKKKYKKSSDKGSIGGAYSVDARKFKSAEQRARVKKNLESNEGLKRLLKNTNPIYWLLALGEVWDGQRDYRWTHINSVLESNPNLEKSLQHRIAHILRLDDKKYYSDKLFAIMVMCHCKLFHPKFLKDYIKSYYTTDSFLDDVTVSTKYQEHPNLKHVDHNKIATGASELLSVIEDILMNWDYQYEHPDYLNAFFDWASAKLELYQKFYKSKKYKDHFFKTEHQLKGVCYHYQKSNSGIEDTVMIESSISQIDIERVTNAYNIFYEIFKKIKSSKNEEITHSAEQFNDLKENLYHLLIPIKNIVSSFQWFYKLKKEGYINLYQKHKGQLYTIAKFLSSIKNDIGWYNSSTYWDINKNIRDYFLYDLISFLDQLFFESYTLEEIKKEIDTQKALINNPKLIDQLLNHPQYDYDFPFDPNGDDIDKYLEYKYKEEAEQYGYIKHHLDGVSSDFWLKVKDTEAFAASFLKDFHSKTEKEQTTLLELLYLSGATVPDASYYNNTYQYYLMVLNIFRNWPKDQYILFLKSQLVSDNTDNIVTCLKLPASTLFLNEDRSKEILKTLSEYWNIKLPVEIRSVLIDEIENHFRSISNVHDWWKKEESIAFLTNWIMQEEDKVIKEKVGKFYRWVKKLKR
ncbi:hypothetical protein [Flavivirga jejuensis]|uniref:EH signature protein n=1 Tax=Flavivirga jejuensis TaxID=870487 RepID=A0ABT8WKK6_9FLAO|nr:hypothetical protein [Flavivirga jejuensis]MDO5973680.1 hypothetical protein [Flavivirga jejuensis]